MSFPLNFMYFKNYTLANIPTKLMYKHRVDYYDYTTVLYSIHITCNKLHVYISKQFQLIVNATATSIWAMIKNSQWLSSSSDSYL